MNADQAVMAALDVIGRRAGNAGPIVSLTDPPQDLILPNAVFPSFWAAYPNLGHAPVNGLPVLRGDVRERGGGQPGGGLSPHGGLRRQDRAAPSLLRWSRSKGRGGGSSVISVTVARGMAMCLMHAPQPSDDGEKAGRIARPRPVIAGPRLQAAFDLVQA